MLTPELSVDEVARALSFLSPEEIMPLRCVNITWKDAVKKTIVPPTDDFLVNNERRYNALNVMARVLPNLQQIVLGSLRGGHKYNDGEDPDEEEAASTAPYTTHDIEIISNFSKLCILEICDAGLNGRYPFLFNSFPLLQKLRLNYCYNLKWDLGMLAGLPLLKELYCSYNYGLTGNINNLRLINGTLESVMIDGCGSVEGNFMDLADFPHLKELDLDGTAVTGDIRDIGDNDFSSLEQLKLPKGVFCGQGYKLQRISDAPDVARAVYLLKKQRPALEYHWYATLSGDSPDWYESAVEDFAEPPFSIRLVEVGPRIGYRWQTKYDDPCEINWLDPEPKSGSSDYEDYAADYHSIRKADFYRGYYDPPSEEEYNLLYEEILSESDEDDED